MLFYRHVSFLYNYKIPRNISMLISRTEWKFCILPLTFCLNAQVFLRHSFSFLGRSNSWQLSNWMPSKPYRCASRGSFSKTVEIREILPLTQASFQVFRMMDSKEKT
jgi:hypothetical protein